MGISGKNRDLVFATERLAWSFLFWEFYKRKGFIQMCGVMQGLVLGMQGLSGVMGASGQYAEGQANAAALRAQANVNEANARQAELNGEDARQKGMVKEEARRREYAQLKGQQVTTAAANGLDMSGSVLDILQDTKSQEEEDAAWIRHNAQKEKWGFLAEQQQHLSDAKNNREAAKNAIKAGRKAAFTTLLGTAASIGVSALGMKGTGGGTKSAAGGTKFTPSISGVFNKSAIEIPNGATFGNFKLKYF